MRSKPPRRNSRKGLGLLAAFLVAMTPSPLPAQETQVAVEEEAAELLLVSPENPSLEWREAKYNVGITALMIDDVERETGIGFEISGPDPYRDLEQMEKKFVPNWRVGFNFFDFNDPITGAQTDLTVYTLAIGYDYYFERSTKVIWDQPEGQRGQWKEVRNPSLFLSSFLSYYAKDRSGGNPNRGDDNFGSLNLGFGWAGPKFRFRYDHSFLEGGGQTADTIGLAYTF